MSEPRTFNGALFPLKISVLRRAAAKKDICPECGGELDTGFECNTCRYDARDEAYPPHMRGRDTQPLPPLPVTERSE